MFTPHQAFSPEQLIFPLVVLIVGLAFWGWMFRDMIDNNELPASVKQNWVFAFIIFNVFAAVVYYVQEYRSSH